MAIVFCKIQQKYNTMDTKEKMESYVLCLQLFFFLPKCWTFRNYWAAHKKFQSWIPNFHQFNLELGICVIVRWCIHLNDLCLITTKNFCPISSTAKLSVLCSTVCVFYSTVLGVRMRLANEYGLTVPSICEILWLSSTELEPGTWYLELFQDCIQHYCWSKIQM
jgi:hypothetical protein